MSAVFKPADSLEARFEPMTHANLTQVINIEQSAYKYPWTRGNFSDSLASGYKAQMLVGGQATPGAPAPLLGYFVAMKGVDEVHLLNITVAPTHQSQGWGRLMLDGLALAETTPGPLVMVLSFVGFLAGFRHPVGLDPLAGGILGAVLTTWVTFVPCFLWIFLGFAFAHECYVTYAPLE